MSRILEIMEKLPPQLQREVEHFAEVLAHTHAGSQTAPACRMDVSRLYGRLADLKDRYASGVEMQHDILNEWTKSD